MTIQLTIYIAKCTIQLTIHVAKWLYNWLYTLPNDYAIDYTHRQMTIQLTMYIVKWLYNWLYT